MADAEPAAARVPLRSARPALTGGLIAAGVIAADQASKGWALYVYDLPTRQHVNLSPVMDLSMVWNRGVSFGLLHSNSDVMRWALTGFMLVVAGLLAWWLWRARRPLLGAALGLVIGGAIGNAIDRIAYGAVADFLDFSDIFFPWVFNIADASICIGVALMLLDSLLTRDETAK